MGGITRNRALPSGIALSTEDASVAKGMLLRGDRQHDIAAWFGVNGGRIAEIATGAAFGWVTPANQDDLPPVGPYPRGKDAMAALKALSEVERALEAAKADLISKH